MPSLKDIAGKSYSKATLKNRVIRHISLLFIKSESRPYYIIMNQSDWNYLKSLPNITEYLYFTSKKSLYEKGMVGIIWGFNIYN